MFHTDEKKGFITPTVRKRSKTKEKKIFSLAYRTKIPGILQIHTYIDSSKSKSYTMRYLIINLLIEKRMYKYSKI